MSRGVTGQWAPHRAPPAAALLVVVILALPLPLKAATQAAASATSHSPLPLVAQGGEFLLQVTARSGSDPKLQTG